MTTIESPLAALPGVDATIELVPLFRGCGSSAPTPSCPTDRRDRGPSWSGRTVASRGRGIRARATGTAGADWLLVGPDGIGTADWRGTVETDDGAVVYVHGDGRCDLSSGFAGGTLLIGGCQFETGDERYRWLNKVHAVYRGVVVGDGIAGDGVYHDEYFEVR